VDLTHVLETADAEIAYDVRGPLRTADGRAPLFMIGQPLTASGFDSLRAANALLPPELFECPFECLRRVTLRSEASLLQPSRGRTVGPIPVRPHRAAVDSTLLELEDLTLLHHRSLSSHVASV
jgi:hypothetical protein